MKTLYLDIFSGISGDMFIGAMLDLGVDLETLKSELGKLNVDGYHVHAQRKSKSGIEGFKFDVHDESAHSHHAHGAEHPHRHTHSHEKPDHEHHEHDHHAPENEHGHGHDHGPGHGHHHHEHGDSRNFTDIRQLIETADLTDWVKSKSISVFHRIAVAEGKIHGHPPEEVHFHEVGAIDSIVDIVGACICLEQLDRPRVVAGPVTEGTGFVMCAHGRFPVPTMATLEILGARGIPLNQCDEPHELVTPTGAALLTTWHSLDRPPPGARIRRAGYGFGHRTLDHRPNVLRAVLGESEGQSVERDWERDVVVILETNLDDASGEILGGFLETAMATGALDVFHTPVQMKKNRPGVVLTVVSSQERADEFTELILRETSAFGVRRSKVDRCKLRREVVGVKTAYGEVDVKLGRLGGRIVQASPEYESCRALADAAGVTLRDVFDAANRAVER